MTNKKNTTDLSTIHNIGHNAPMSDNQIHWLSGYNTALTSLKEILETNGVTGQVQSDPLHIIYSSQTGNAQMVAENLAEHMNSAIVNDIIEINTDSLSKIKNLILIASTYGDGEHTDGGQVIWDSVQSIPSFSGMKYAVLGLGDTAYDLFCQSAIDWDKFFSDKGATNVVPLIKLDVDYDDHIPAWIETIKQAFPITTAPTISVQGQTSPVTVIYGSQTGNAESIATDLANALGTENIFDMIDVSADDFKNYENVVIVTSTYGDGEHTDNGQILWEAVQSIDNLQTMNYAILGLGDTAYDLFCQSAKDWNKFLESKGATPIVPMENLDVDYDDYIPKWSASIQSAFANLSQSNESVKEPKKVSKYTKTAPYYSKIIKNKVLSSNESDKKVCHFEFSIDDAELTYETGDALGVFPFNAEKYINDILSASGFSKNETVSVKGESISLYQALETQLEIRLANRDFINAVALKVNDTNLHSILDGDKDTLNSYLYGRETLDFLLEYKPTFTAQEFVDLMKPLQSRLYSISSSPDVHKAQVHLTVSTVQYSLNDRQCFGVASNFMADMASGDKIGIYVHPNKSFSIPSDGSVPMIMVGPGTGIAPFRAFIEQRIHDGATGKNWLFFGDRNSQHDFIYQQELQQWIDAGKLELTTAWSRDKDIPKTYVQHKMLENGKQLFHYLEQGGYFFICGDATYMAKDVESALLEIIATHGAMTIEKATAYINTLKRDKRYVRDVY